MKKNLFVLALTGLLIFAIAVPILAAEPAAVPISTSVAEEEMPALPDSVLYYGTLREIVKDKNGNITQLCLDSERYGEYVMNITEQTVWVDSRLYGAGDPADLQTGDGIYVFHSMAATSSLPPQSMAFAVVWNVPMDAGCAQLHEVEAISLEEDQLKMTTDNGGFYLLIDENTKLSLYGSDETVTKEDIQTGSWVMAWYDAYAASYPGQAYADHLMVLPQEEQPAEDPLTRGELLMMLHELAGKPVVNYAMRYTDVEEGAEYAEAIRWAASERIAGGYGDGTFGPEDAVSLEQMVTIFWHYMGSPMLMDYPGLTEFDDACEISHFAQPAFAWAHQNGFISAQEDGLLHPQADASRQLAENILQELSI